MATAFCVAPRPVTTPPPRRAAAIVRSRSACAALVALACAALGGCPDDPTPRPRPATAPTGTHAPPTTVGVGDQPPPQVRMPVVAQPPRAVEPPPPPGATVSYAPLTAGARTGGLLAWAAAPDPAARPAGGAQVLMRTVEAATGALGPAFFVAQARGPVRAVAIAARAADALVVWSAEVNPGWAHAAVQRVRHDGTRLGSPVALGLFQIVPGRADAGARDDALGHVARALATGAGYAVALRGPAVDVPAPTASVRFVEVNDDNDLGVGGTVEHAALLPPLVMLATPGGATWSAALTLGGVGAAPTVRGVGQGPLAQLVVPRGAPLLAAWIPPDAAAAHALVRRTAIVTRGPRVGGLAALESVELVPPPAATAATPDAGATAGADSARVDRMRVVCAGGVAATELVTRAGAEVVPATAPGGDALATFVLARAASAPPASPPAPARAPSRRDSGADASASAVAPPPTLAAWTGGGMLVLSDGRAGFARCEGNALGAPAPLAWSNPAP